MGQNPPQQCDRPIKTYRKLLFQVNAVKPTESQGILCAVLWKQFLFHMTIAKVDAIRVRCLQHFFNCYEYIIVHYVLLYLSAGRELVHNLIHRDHGSADLSVSEFASHQLLLQSSLQCHKEVKVFHLEQSVFNAFEWIPKSFVDTFMLPNSECILAS